MSESNSRPKALVDLSHVANSISMLLFSSNAWLPSETVALEFGAAVRKHLEAAAALAEAYAAKHREFIRESANREDEVVASEIASLRAALQGVRYSGLDESFLGERTRAFHTVRSDARAEEAIPKMPPIDVDGFSLEL